MSLVTCDFSEIIHKEYGTEWNALICHGGAWGWWIIRIKLWSRPPGGGKSPSNVKVNLKPVSPPPPIWLNASKWAAHTVFPRCPAPVGHLTYRHVDLFLFPSVCGHSARSKKKNQNLVGVHWARSLITISYMFRVAQKKGFQQLTVFILGETKQRIQVT